LIPQENDKRRQLNVVKDAVVSRTASGCVGGSRKVPKVEWNTERGTRKRAAMNKLALYDVGVVGLGQCGKGGVLLSCCYQLLAEGRSDVMQLQQ